MGKPRGIRCARKMVNRRREQLWADKQYKKANLGTKYKCNPFGGTSHAKGIVVEKIGIEAKQPNSAIRKCCRVQLIKNGKKIAAFVPRDGCLNFIDENDEADTSCRVLYLNMVCLSTSVRTWHVQFVSAELRDACKCWVGVDVTIVV
jgi:ribosomal protein uS12